MELDLDSIADLVDVQNIDDASLTGVQNEKKTDDEQPKEIEAKKKIIEKYVDPVTQKYITETNNMSGGKVWREQGDGRILSDLWLVEKQRNIDW